MKFTLRPYQENTLDLLREQLSKGHKRPILCLPTGAGKTVTFSHLADAAIKKGNYILVVCHRKELIHQAKKTMSAYGCDMTKINFGMVQTFIRSPEKVPIFDLCIIDECHIGNFRKFVDLYPFKPIIGATATPMSATKKNPLRNTFDTVVSPVDIPTLIDSGYLAKPIHKRAIMDESDLIKGSNGDFTVASQEDTFNGLFENIEDAYNERRGKTIIFCSSISMSIKVASQFFAYCVHSKMPEKERDEVIEAFKNDPDGVIVNCGILTAGFDEPSIETVIVFRATTSLSLWMQMCGRGSRVTPNKTEFIIFDLGNNIKRHGIWHFDRDWNVMFENEGNKNKLGVAPVKECPECEALNNASASICNFCGFEFPKKPKQKVVAQDFETIEYGNLPPNLKGKRWEEMSVNELIERAKIGSKNTGRPYKIGWIVSQLKRSDEPEKKIKEFARIKGYKDGWITRQLLTL